MFLNSNDPIIISFLNSFVPVRPMLLSGSVLQDPNAHLRVDRPDQRRIRSKSARQSIPSAGRPKHKHKHSNCTTTTTTYHSTPTTTHYHTLRSTTHHNTLRTTTNHHTLRATSNHHSLCTATNHHEVLPTTDHYEPSISR